MKIVIASDLYKPSVGGTETVTNNMAANLSKLGYDVRVFAPAEKGRKTPYKQADEGFEVVRFRSFNPHVQKNARFGLRPDAEIAGYFAGSENLPDMIHVNNPFPLSRSMIRFARKNSIPLVVGGHLMPQSVTFGLHKLKPLYNFLNFMGWHYITRIYNKADMVVSPTKTAINYLCEHGLKVPAQAISNGIDLKLNAPVKKSKLELKKKLNISTKYTLLYVGRLGVEKRIDIILKAFALVADKFDISLVLVGDGNARKKLEKLARELKIDSQVTFSGYVTGAQAKKEYFAVADCFVISSSVELQSLVTMEAMAQALPVVAVNAGALPELCKNNKNGYTFAENDYEQLSEKLYKLFASPADMGKFSKESLSMIQKHDYKLTWKKYDEMYKKLMKIQEKEQ